MIKPLRIQPTNDSPEITLDKEMGRFEFYGKSLPENPNEFFQPVLNWFKEYVKDPNKETVLVFKMDYFNTASSKRLLDIISICYEIHKKKLSIIINWYYRFNDEDMKDTGESFSEIAQLPFIFLSY